MIEEAKKMKEELEHMKEVGEDAFEEDEDDMVEVFKEDPKNLAEKTNESRKKVGIISDEAIEDIDQLPESDVEIEAGIKKLRVKSWVMEENIPECEGLLEIVEPIRTFKQIMKIIPNLIKKGKLQLSLYLREAVIIVKKDLEEEINQVFLKVIESINIDTLEFLIELEYEEHRIDFSKSFCELLFYLKDNSNNSKKNEEIENCLDNLEILEELNQNFADLEKLSNLMYNEDYVIIFIKF